MTCIPNWLGREDSNHFTVDQAVISAVKPIISIYFFRYFIYFKILIK